MKIIYLFIFLLSLNTFAQNNNFNSLAVYRAELSNNLNERLSTNEKLNLPYTILNGRTVNFNLLFNNEESLFSVERKLNSANDIKEKMAIALFGGSTVSYNNIKSDESLNYIEAYGESFLIPISNKKWKLTKEKRKIAGYICYKAETDYIVNNNKGRFEKKAVAWYAVELNYPFGPKGYSGLPGLILELSLDNFIYRLIELRLNQTKKKIVKPKKGKTISKKEFEEIGMQIGNQRIRQ